MAVEKMRFVNVTGRINELDNFVISTIVPHDIQLEYATQILDSVKELELFSEENPYERLNKKVSELMNVLEQKLEYDPTRECALMPVSVLEPEIDGYERQLETIQRISRSLKSDLEHKREVRRQVYPLRNLDIQIDKLFRFKYMKFRFGKMSLENYEKLTTYLEELDVLAIKVSEEKETVYLMYFTPASRKENIDSFFASLFFERIWISDDVKGLPSEALDQVNEEIQELEERIAMLEKDSKDFISRNFDRLQELYNYTVELYEVFEVRRYAVKSKEAFYLTGWIPESQVSVFKERIRALDDITCILEDDKDVIKTKPPTKLKNAGFFKPFEALVGMYGTPSYNEIDPTPFVAITYILFFGIMFGDLGQGLVIAIAAWFFYAKKGVKLAKLGIYIGCASVVSGFFYGSLFGNEEILRHLFPMVPMIKPMDNMMPMLGASIVFGIILILIAMGINMYNCYKQGNMSKLLLDSNGITGLILYIAIICLVLVVALGADVSPSIPVILGVFIVGPILILFFSENILKWAKRHEKSAHKEEASPVVERVFEIVEILISIISNTISFIRVGAFALNHVGLFMAFQTLAGFAGGAGSVVIMIFGNILIIVLEGMIVGIQGLRLEYYELFSRFFTGDGVEFKPFKIKG